MHPNTFDGTPCPYCERPMDRRSVRMRPTRDHVIPRSRGGTEMRACCSQCNGIKGDMMPAEWAAYMAANPGYWRFTTQERRRSRRLAARLRGVADGHGNIILPRGKQGTPPLSPVVVPPELIWP